MSKRISTKLLPLLLVVATLTTVLAACTVTQPEQPQEITIIDQTGASVTIPANVQRVVCIDPDVTLVVYELNGQDKLAGMALGRMENQVMPILEAVYPLSSQIPLVGASSEANMEQILSLDPDVILATSFPELAEMSESMKVPAVCVAQESADEMKESYRLVGEVIGREEEADAIINYFNVKEDYIIERTDKIADTNKKRVYITAVDPVSTMGGDMFQEYLIETAGGENVASDLSGFGAQVSMEQILQWNPDVILVVSYCQSSARDIMVDAQWQSLPAVKEGKVFDYPTFMGPWDAPGSKSIIGMIWLASKLYPDEMSFDIVKEIKEFYSKVYRYDISDTEIDQILKPR